MSEYSAGKPVFDIDPDRHMGDFTEGEEILLEVRELAMQIGDSLPQSSKVQIGSRIVEVINEFMGIEDGSDISS